MEADIESPLIEIQDISESNPAIMPDLESKAHSPPVSDDSPTVSVECSDSETSMSTDDVVFEDGEYKLDIIFCNAYSCTFLGCLM